MGGFEPELQTNPMLFRLDSPWGAALIPLRSSAMEWGRNRILRVRKKPFVDQSSRTFGQCRGPPVLSNVLARLSMACLFRRYSRLSFEVVKKPNKCERFWPQIFLEGLPRLLRQIVSAIYCPPFGKVWLSSVCWTPSAKLGNEVKCRIYGG